MWVRGVTISEEEMREFLRASPRQRLHSRRPRLSYSAVGLRAGNRHAFEATRVAALGLFRHLTDLKDFEVFHWNVLHKGALVYTIR